MGLFDFFKKTKSNDFIPNSNTKILFGEEQVEHILDNIMEFLDVYLSVVPNGWYYLYISQDFESVGNTIDGYITFEIKLGNWWNNLLYKYPDIEEYMLTIFTFNPYEKTFKYSIRTGYSMDRKLYQEKINSILQRFLGDYERKHPKVHFKRTDWGAILSNKN